MLYTKVSSGFFRNHIFNLVEKFYKAIISLDENFTPALEVIQPSSDVEARLRSVETQLYLMQKSGSIEPEIIEGTPKSPIAQGDVSHSHQPLEDTKK